MHERVRKWTVYWNKVRQSFYFIKTVIHDLIKCKIYSPIDNNVSRYNKGAAIISFAGFTSCPKKGYPGNELIVMSLRALVGLP